MDPKHEPRAEKDGTNQGWKHPYALYILGTILLFLFLLGMGYFAVQNDWIPKR